MTNLRYADDVLLAARTRHQIRSMLSDVSSAAAAVGLLALRADIAKVWTNVGKSKGRGTQSNLVIDGLNVEILPQEGAAKYLGKMLGS
eukprot:3684048-Pyramimonas_sp.AAC.1